MIVVPGDDDQTNLFQFDDEEPIEASGRQADGRTERASSDRSSQDPFVLELKTSACERNAAVGAIAAEEGRRLEFGSRQEAAAFADEMTTDGGVRVRLQAVAPQDETRADAYLIPRPVRYRDEPIDPDATTWAFQPGANQYGAIGQALVTTPRTNPPALSYFVRRDLGIDGADLTVRLRDPDAVTMRLADGTKARWDPDAVAEARRESTGATLRTYVVEIKTGDASFEREQRAIMERKATAPNVSVLQVRVEVDDLPDEYGVRIREVAP